MLNSLQQIWSIGWFKSRLISVKMGFCYPLFINNINMYNFSGILFLLKNLTLSEIRLKRMVRTNILKLTNINTYVGLRHSLSLPVRGQRTRTNAGTMRRLQILKNSSLWD